MRLAITNVFWKNFLITICKRELVIFTYISPKLCITHVSSKWLSDLVSNGWTFWLRCWCFCAAVQKRMENVPYRPGTQGLEVKSFWWELQRRRRCAMPDQSQQGSSAPALWHRSSSHLLSEANGWRRIGKKLFKPSVLWIIRPANWSCMAGYISERCIAFSFKSKWIKYGPSPISPTVNTGGFLLTSAELVTALYS